jgi:hypothetical protein
MMETVPFPEVAAQIALPSAETSNPSDPLPTFTSVSFQFPTGRSNGRPRPATLTSVFSMTLTVPELTFVVTVSFIWGGNINHVGSILAGARNPIHALADWIISADRLGAFGGEARFPGLRMSVHEARAGLRNQRLAMPFARPDPPPPVCWRHRIRSSRPTPSCRRRTPSPCADPCPPVSAQSLASWKDRRSPAFHRAWPAPAMHSQVCLQRVRNWFRVQ